MYGVFMGDRWKIAALVVTGILIVLVCILLFLQIGAGKCDLAYPLHCTQPYIDENFTITIGNEGDEPIWITNVAVSRQERPCVFPRSQYDRLGSHEAIVYVISADHSDGVCLLSGMEKGVSYRVDIIVEYEIAGISRTSSGSAQVTA